MKYKIGLKGFYDRVGRIHSGQQKYTNLSSLPYNRLSRRTGAYTRLVFALRTELMKLNYRLCEGSGDRQKQFSALNAELNKVNNRYFVALQLRDKMSQN